jgi:hypothetical protein
MFDPDTLFRNPRVSDNTGRCSAMTMPQYVGTMQIDGRLVCAAHGRRLAAIRYCDEASG